jgi:Recombination endonuclease VII
MSRKCAPGCQCGRHQPPPPDFRSRKCQPGCQCGRHRPPQAEKRCPRCDQVKPVAEFGAGGKRGRPQSYCKACDSARGSQRFRENPEPFYASLKRQREAKPEKFSLIELRRRAREYGLDPDEVLSHYKAHNGLCDICGQPPSDRYSTGKSQVRLGIDHDHKTGKFRGLLCRKCNLAIGNMDDNPKWLMAAAFYLERNS